MKISDSAILTCDSIVRKCDAYADLRKSVNGLIKDKGGVSGAIRHAEQVIRNREEDGDRGSEGYRFWLKVLEALRNRNDSAEKSDATDFSNMTTATLRNMIPGLTEKSVPTKKQAEAELAKRMEKRDDGSGATFDVEYRDNGRAMVRSFQTRHGAESFFDTCKSDPHCTDIELYDKTGKVLKSAD